jgi:CrcB protein
VGGDAAGATGGGDDAAPFGRVILAGLVVAGAIGAVSRCLVDGLVRAPSRRGFPVGTFVVNVSGSLVLGLVTGAALYHGFPHTPRVWLGTGFCGAYTTFSTFTFESVALLEEGAVGGALTYVAASAVAGALAAAVGLWVAGLL